LTLEVLLIVGILAGISRRFGGGQSGGAVLHLESIRAKYSDGICGKSLRFGEGAIKPGMVLVCPLFWSMCYESISHVFSLS